MKISSKIAIKSKSLRSAEHYLLEDALMTYLRCVINTAHGTSILCEHVLRQKALKIRDSILLWLEKQKLKVSVDNERNEKLSKGITSLLQFKASLR